MSARMIIELPAGHKVLLGGGGPEVGLSEVGVGADIVKATSDKFKSAMGSLAGLVAAMEESVGRLDRRPDKLEMEFGATFSADCDLWIVSGKGEADFKVTLSWGKSG